MGLSKNDGKNPRTRAKGYPFTISRDGQRIVTDRESGTVLGSITAFGNRWDYSTTLGFVSSPYGYEDITSAAQALHRTWKKMAVAE